MPFYYNRVCIGEFEDAMKYIKAKGIAKEVVMDSFRQEDLGSAMDMVWELSVGNMSDCTPDDLLYNTLCLLQDWDEGTRFGGVSFKGY